MHIEQLQLVNFRNYKQLDITFDDKINVIIGENAQGKTNLMEAIYVLAFTKSYRTPRDKELINWDEDFAKITGKIVKKNRQIPLEVLMMNRGKRVKLNHLEQRRLSDFIGALNVVMFAPEDLSLVKGSPQIRRRFIDMELGQIQPSYLYHLGQYQKVLQQRNHLLKQLRVHKNQDDTFLTILTEQLIEHGVSLLERRFEFIERLEKWASPIHHDISRGKEQLTLVYKPTIDVLVDDKREKIEEVFNVKFNEIKDREIERGTTLVGPHRDDITFYVNEKDVQTYGSQGQQRTTALSVKLAELDLIYDEIGEYPVLLLDDVLSELDTYRQTHLLDTIQGKVQTFVSTTSVEDIDHDVLNKAEMFHVKSGEVFT